MGNNTKYTLVLVGALLLIMLSALALSGSLNNIELTNNPSQSFFTKNWGNKSHEVTVEVFNSKNISIFNKSYISAPKEEMMSPFPTTLVPKTYIEVTLDNNITKTQIVSEDFSEGDSELLIDIDMHPNDPLVLGTAVP